MTTPGEFDEIGAPLAAARGGPSTFAGMRYQTLVAEVELLIRLSAGGPAPDPQVVMEPRVVAVPGNRQVGFDLRIQADTDALVEVKLRPTGHDAREWLANVAAASAALPGDTRFVLAHNETSPATRTLRMLAAVANEATTVTEFTDRLPNNSLARQCVEILGAGLLDVLRRIDVVHRPRDAEERLAITVAHHICRESAQALALLNHLRALVSDAAERRGRLHARQIADDLAGRGILLEQIRALPSDLRADATARADGRCCVCHRPGLEVDVHLINGVPSDHDPDNLAVLCASCWDASRESAGVAPSMEAERLARHRREWDWLVARERRAGAAPVERAVTQDMADLRELLRRHLVEDFHWDGPRRGEFARLGGRMEDRFYQANRGERLTARPAYYHTYWGLVGSQRLLADLFPTYAEVAADGVASRLSQTGWVTVDLEDYSASPSVGRRRVQTIRHTARAAMILLLAQEHPVLAADVAWNVLDEAGSSMTEDGGWHEFRNEPRAPATLYSSMYVLQLLSSIKTDDRWAGLIADLSLFRERAAPVSKATWEFMAAAWELDRWSMNGMPWHVNAAAILADIGPYVPAPLGERVHDALRGMISSSGRLVDPNAGDEWDAPEPVLSVRIAFALSRLPIAAGDDRLAAAQRRLTTRTWTDVPLRTMDVAFLAQLVLPS